MKFMDIAPGSTIEYRPSFGTGATVTTTILTPLADVKHGRAGGDTADGGWFYADTQMVAVFVNGQRFVKVSGMDLYEEVGAFNRNMMR